jgi:hypothetical protein
MFIHLIVMNAYSPITGIICMICLIFLFFEAVFGICLGCKFYSLVYKEKAQYCPGEVCDVKSRQEIQKTSAVQLLVVMLFAVFIFVSTFLFKETLTEKPYDIFGIESSTHTK